MNKIILTQHVKERRKTGFIPTERLRHFADFLINEHNLPLKQKGSYKFRRDGTCAIIIKENSKFTFITLYGPSGWIIDSDDFTGFSCEIQSEERVALATARSRHSAKCKALGIKDNGKKIKVPKVPLRFLSAKHRELIKRDTFETIAIPEKRWKYLHARFGHKPKYILVSKFDSYGFVELLSFDGRHIQTFRKDTWDKI